MGVTLATPLCTTITKTTIAYTSRGISDSSFLALHSTLGYARMMQEYVGSCNTTCVKSNGCSWSQVRAGSEEMEVVANLPICCFLQHNIIDAGIIIPIDCRLMANVCMSETVWHRDCVLSAVR